MCLQKILNSTKSKMDDYSSNNSEDSHERKDAKELETLIEYRMAADVAGVENSDLKRSGTAPSSALADEQNV